MARLALDKYLAPHQKDAVHGNDEYPGILWTLNENKKCLLWMFCGTGKTRVAFSLMIGPEPKLKLGQGLRIIVFPSLSLITQFDRDYLRAPEFQVYTTRTKCICVCSHRDDKPSTEEERELMSTYTTDQAGIEEFLTSSTGIIAVTYQSLPTLISILEKTKVAPSLVIYDEAHRALGEKAQQVVFGGLGATYTVFMTATPENANGITMFDPEDDEGYTDCGPVAFRYSYPDGIEDGFLNPFQVVVERRRKNDPSMHMYEIIAHASARGPNNRVLSFHTRVTDDEMCVKEFVSDESKLLQAARNLGFSRVWLRGLTSGLRVQDCLTGEDVRRLGYPIHPKSLAREHLLRLFDSTPDDTLAVLASCRTIGEGTDTKRANQVVFVNPKNSVRDILQNIGRGVRKQDRVTNVVVPCFVDVDAYLALEPDKRHDYLVSAWDQPGGDYSTVRSVLEAVKSDDPKYYALCLEHPHKYTPEERTRTFTKQGFQPSAEVFDTPEDAVRSALGVNTPGSLDVLTVTHNVRVEVHTPDLDNPVEEHGPPGATTRVRLSKNEGGYRVLRRLPSSSVSDTERLRPPSRVPLLRVEDDPNLQATWSLQDTVAQLRTVVLECEVSGRERRALALAKEHVKWTNEHGGQRPVEAKRKEAKKRLENQDPATVREHRLFKWFVGFQQAARFKHGVSSATCSVKLYDSVVAVVTEAYGSHWYLYDDREAEALSKALEHVRWTKERGERPQVQQTKGDKGRLKSGDATVLREHQLAKWYTGFQCTARSALRPNVDRTKYAYYESAGKVLAGVYGPTWYEFKNEGKALEKAKRYVRWTQEHGGQHPVAQTSKDAKERLATGDPATTQEHQLSKWFDNFKRSFRTTRHLSTSKTETVPYPSTVRLLLEAFGPQWYAYESKEASALTKAKEYVRWSNEHGGRRPTGVRSKTGKERLEAGDREPKKEKQLYTWFHGFQSAARLHYEGKRQGAYYPSTGEYLSTHLGRNWHLKKTDHHGENVSTEEVSSLSSDGSTTVTEESPRKRSAETSTEGSKKKAKATTKRLYTGPSDEAEARRKRLKEGTLTEEDKAYFDKVLSSNGGGKPPYPEELRATDADKVYVNEQFVQRCDPKNPGLVCFLESPALTTTNHLLRRGFKLDKLRCPQADTESYNKMKHHPHIVQGFVGSFLSKEPQGTYQAVWLDYTGSWKGNVSLGVSPQDDVETIFRNKLFAKSGGYLFVTVSLRGENKRATLYADVRQFVEKVASESGYSVGPVENGLVHEYSNMLYVGFKIIL